MKVTRVPITSMLGGLNNRDRPSELKPDEAAELENWLTDEGGIGHKRDGKDLIQFSPIDPEAFVSDANTLGLWHLNESYPGPYVNSGTGFVDAEDFQIFYSTPTETVDGLFSTARKFSQATSGVFLAGAIYSNGGSGVLNGKSACTFEAWIYVKSSYSSRPIKISSSPDVYVSNNSVPILATDLFGISTGPTLGTFRNGLRLFRDWDNTNSKNSSDPYVKFTILTNGVLGTSTTITSGAIPMNRWVHVRGTYNNSEAVMRLYVNGALSTSASVNGGGTILDPVVVSGSSYAAIFGGTQALSINPDTQAILSQGILPSTVSIDGFLEECRISDIDRGGDLFPFKKPRGKGFELAKVDGTRQEIISAEDALYYTIGDGAWTKIIDTNPGGSALSLTAFWDAVQVGEILYLSNDVDQPLAWDGTRILPWGEGVAPLTLAVSGNVAGSLSAGTYKYAYTYVYEDGETGPSPMATIAVGANDQVTISDIPTRHSNCESIRIYRTLAGGDIFYLIREIANDPNQTSLVMDGTFVANGAPDEDSGKDGVPDATLTGDVDYILMSGVVTFTSIQKFQFLTSNFNRIFGTGVNDRRFDVFFSEFSPDVFQAANFIRAKADKGPITGVTNYESEIHASKSGNATLVLRGDNPNTWSQFETLHATLGSIDHWGYVLRTVPGVAGGTDRTILCFPARDGFYAYSGADFFKISDKVQTTIQGLGAVNATRAEYTLTTQFDFQAQNNLGGSTTQNIRNDNYETDGLREDAGKIKFVDQLDYIGLWTDTGALVPGKVIAVCKGPLEGEFIFATDANRNLYRTTDNFATAAGLAVATRLDDCVGTPELVTDDHRIIEITYASIGGADNYWIFTSDTSEKGYVALWDQTNSFWANSATVFAGPYAWQADISWRLLTSSVVNNFNVPNTDASYAGQPDNTKGFWAIGKGGPVPTVALGTNTGTAFRPDNGSNLHISHSQKITVNTIINSAGVYAAVPGVNIFSQSSKTSADAGFGSISSAQFNIRPAYQSGDTPTLAAGFHSFSDDGTFVNNQVSFGTNPNRWVRRGSGGFAVQFTKRETAFWRGGTFRPQSFWDATNNLLWFSGSSSALDASGNRVCSIVTISSSGAATVVYTPAQNSFLAITTDGTNIYWTEQEFDGDNVGRGFQLKVGKSPLATFLASVVNFGSSGFGFLPVRLSGYPNSNVGTAIGKYWDGESFDNDSHGGFIANYTGVGNFTIIKNFPNNSNAAAFPLEIIQETVEPLSKFVVMQNVQVGAPTYVYEVDANGADVSAFNAEAYTGNDASASVNGIISNLIFVPSSGSAGGFLWSDRLYWFGNAVESEDARMIQLGVPGSWEVRGSFEAAPHNLGTFDAFDTLDVDYVAPQVDFSVRYGQDAATIAAADYLSQEANKRILGFTIEPIPAIGENGGFVQWNIDFVWRYTVTAPTFSPEVSFVSIGYFLGNALIPRIVGVHFNSRTYWAVAESGSLENNLILVYQKNNTWSTYTGWPVKAFNIFRNMLVGLEDYAFMRYEIGDTDAGNLIRSRILMGAVMNSRVDKMLNDVKANVTTFVNKDFVNKNGYMTLTPVRGGEEQPSAAWSFPIPDDTDTLPRQVQALPTDGTFTDFWMRAFQLLLETSKETSGDFVPFVGQKEDVQALLIEVWETEDSYAIDVN